MLGDVRLCRRRPRGRCSGGAPSPEPVLCLRNVAAEESVVARAGLEKELDESFGAQPSLHRDLVQVVLLVLPDVLRLERGGAHLVPNPRGPRTKAAGRSALPRQTHSRVGADNAAKAPGATPTGGAFAEPNLAARARQRGSAQLTARPLPGEPRRVPAAARAVSGAASVVTSEVLLLRLGDETDAVEAAPCSGWGDLPL